MRYKLTKLYEPLNWLNTWRENSITIVLEWLDKCIPFPNFLNTTAPKTKSTLTPTISISITKSITPVPFLGYRSKVGARFLCL